MLAHVRYVTDEVAGDPIEFLTDVLGRVETWLAFGLGGLALLVAIIVIRVRRPLADNWARFAERAWSYRESVPWMLRLSAGLVLIGAGLTGRVFAPDVTIPGWPTALLTAIGFLLLLGLAVRPAAILGLLLFAIALLNAPNLVEILDVAGALAALAFVGPGVPSVDDLARAAFPRAPGAEAATRPQADVRYRDVVPVVVRLGLGGAFVASGIVDKLAVPGQALATVDKYDLTRLVPVDPGLWVVGAAAVETALGLAIVVGLFTRPAAMLAFAVLTLTLFGLPDDPVVAHVGLFGLASVLVVLGAGRWSLDRRLGLALDPGGRRVTDGRRGDRVRGLFLDTTPLRLDRDYRWLWTGQAVNGLGNQITRLALPFQVYVLTQSPLAIAGLTFVQLVPILVLAPLAGSVADAVDRRRLLLLSQTGLALCSAALFVIAIQPEPSIPAIFVVAAIAASIGAVDQPARSSAIPRLVPMERLPAAIALNQLNYQTASVVGPAAGGILLATLGVAGAYLIDVVSFSASMITVGAMRPIPPRGNAPRPGLAAIREGLAFARRRRVILSTFAIDLNAMIFGMPTAVFPVLALDVFRVGPEGLGLLAAAPAAGAFLGALLSGWVSGVRRVGRAVVLSVAGWGVAITGFGVAALAPPGVGFPLGLVFLAVAGAADVLSAVFRSLIVQTMTPDQLRGRITSLHIMVVSSGPRIGDIEAATVAAVIGAPLSVLSGGLACILGTIAVARVFPELARHVHEPEPAGP